MQLPIINGIYRDNSPDLRTGYPVNMVPVPLESGINKGYLRPADGLVQNGTGPGVCKGGINWNGTCFRIMGTKLVSVAQNGTVSTLGDIGSGNGLATFDYGTDRLAIAVNGNLFYWQGASLTQVTDVDLGLVVDVCFIDGYYMTTDGTYLIVTELTDPTAVNPLKYGSAEADPDSIKAVLRLRNEVYAVGRHTIEAFDNVGGDFFPFQRIEGAQIQKGALGTYCCCVFREAIAFLGSGRNEAPGIYIGSNANAEKISTLDIDKLLLEYTETELSNVRVEARNDKAMDHLYVHLSDRTLVFDYVASQAFGVPVWFILTSDSEQGFSQYHARDFVWCYNKWLTGDPSSTKVGYMTDESSYHYGNPVRWEFSTPIIYNEGKGAIIHSLELCALTGDVAFGADPQISTSYSVDGATWSQDRWISAGGFGQSAKRLLWLQQGHMRNWRIQRFRGSSDAHLAVVRLDANIEALNF